MTFRAALLPVVVGADREAPAIHVIWTLGASRFLICEAE
jgi:hypothetical protein